MKALRTSRSNQHRVPRGRVATLCLAASGLAVISVGVGPSSAATSHVAKNVVISTMKTAKFGTLLVSGRTLYTLKPSGTPCTAACQKYWPEVLLPKGVTKAIAGKGVKAFKLGTVKRPGDRLQVTYDRKALYWFSLDTAPGQVKGNVTDTWGKWSDVVTVKPAGTVTTTSPSGGGIGF